MSNVPVLLIEEIVSILVPALIFLFMNKKIFFSDENPKVDLDKHGEPLPHPKLRRFRRLVALMLLSPIGLFIVVFVVILLTELILNSYFIGSGLDEFSMKALLNPSISADGGFTIDPSEAGTNEALLITLVLLFIISMPMLALFIHIYCKVVRCSHGMGVFIYMAVLYMFVASTMVAFPLRRYSPVVSCLASTGAFIVMLLIFYLPASKKIEMMRQDKNTRMLSNTNMLPIINFILLTVLLGLEFMLEINDHLDYTLYAVILAFAVLLYCSTQLSYNVLFLHIEERVQIETLSREAIEAEEEIVLAFAEITEAKSGQTGKHVKRVSEYSRVIAKAMGLPPEKVEEIRLASMMHDIGKLLIPPEVLEKMGRLTEEEFAIMKTHVTIGESLLHNAPGEIMETARLIALQHHEWWNGKGYLGTVGKEIDIAARITAVADVYDALTSKRSYKTAWTSEQAYKIIMEESGSHFDPEVTHAFSTHFGEIKRLQAKYQDNAEYYL